MIRPEIDHVSPYLNLPLRDIEQACRDQARRHRIPARVCAHCDLISICSPKVWHGDTAIKEIRDKLLAMARG